MTPAGEVIGWIEDDRVCRIPEGKLIGQQVKLLPFQKKVIELIYNNRAGTRRAILSFGRKNAKDLDTQRHSRHV